MEREQLLALAESMMGMAIDNLRRDGYVAFATLVFPKEGGMVPIALSDAHPLAKERLGEMLRHMAPHTKATIVISEAWTLENHSVPALSPDEDKWEVVMLPHALPAADMARLSLQHVGRAADDQQMYIRGPEAEISCDGKSDPVGVRASGKQQLGQLHGGMFAFAREVLPRPSEHPDRKEGVFVVASSPYGEVLLTLIFDRDKENKPLPRASMTTRWSDDESASASYSNFQGIYRGVAVSAAERARATSG
jgi:hypothetical protein